jgi:hypothetical protein
LSTGRDISKVQSFPETPTLEDAPDDLFEQGHLWLQEWVVGAPLRFQVTETGLVFGDDQRAFDPWDEPPEYGYAVRTVRERFDEEAFRAAVDTPAEFTFLGVATRHEGIEYDWSRLPGFLGVDLHGPDRGYRPPDLAEQAFERLGLDPVNAVRKELPARDIRPDRYAFPDSAWYEGPVAGVLARNKRGGRALVRNDAVALADPPTVTPETLVAEHVTTDRIDRVVEALGEGASVDAVLDRLVETLVREHYAALGERVDVTAIRSTAAEPVARRLGQ